ncbi:DNA packaging protein UL32 [Saimiriine alphaherpesvirus 1]|uniref:Packaging protein UL32 n=1 Tax=Saimiriine herpesvirus 1 (strain MV-5-4-PSL) TaxID=10353 RepID=E2IUD7_SHV1|nr:DNA packaging protein UL32 [Saimiriine alphaherpesvirus 1]ADO13795.1 DNA packaging protein UL32 [Saimiriine alphaherpesvirus 1]
MASFKGFSAPQTPKPTPLSAGWNAGAFSRPYVAFDARLLALNNSLCGELLTACHLIGVPASEVTDADVVSDCMVSGQTTPAYPPPSTRPHPFATAPTPAIAPRDADAVGVAATGTRTRALDLSPFVAVAGDTFALDRPCLVCGIVELYKRRFGLTPQWAADYAFLCAKCMGAPHCATSTFIAAFEFVYVMDYHYLGSQGATLVGSFNRFALTVNDVHRHFFLHCCFRTDGGVPGKGWRPSGTAAAPVSASAFGAAAATVAPAPTGAGAPKVMYSNYSFLAQAATRALFDTLGVAPGEADAAPGAPARQLGRAPPASLTTALMNWKDCARAMDCTEGRRAGAGHCCARATARNAEFEAAASASPGSAGEETWGYADLALLMLAGTPALSEPSATTRALVDARTQAVCEAWEQGRRDRERDVAPRFVQFAETKAEPDVSAGPLAATVFKHARARGRTGGECPLCNLLVVRPYWMALRRLKRDVLSYSENNASLFDCIAPVLDGWGESGPGGALNDGGRFAGILRSAGIEGVYKHLFCDPMCAVTEVDVDPWVLFEHPTDAAPNALALHKAKLACGNQFEGRVCVALRALVYTFKTYQVFVPKPTALATFVREAGALLRRHALSLVSLEHTISTYV